MLGMQPGSQDQMFQQPGSMDRPFAVGGAPMAPGRRDRIPIQQHGSSGAFYGVQDNAPASYADVPGFGTPMNPTIAPRNPGLDIAALLGLKDKQFGDADPFQQGALRQMFTMQEQLMGTLQNYGQGAMNQVNQDFQTAFNNQQGELAARGLGGSAVSMGDSLALQRERQGALLSLSDQLLGRKFDVLSGTGSGIAELLAGIGGANQQAKLQKNAVQQQLDAKGIGVKGGGLREQNALSGTVNYNRNRAGGVFG